MSNVTTKQNLTVAHNTQVVAGNRFITALRALTTAAAYALADKIAAQILLVGHLVDHAITALTAATAARAEVKVATAQIKAITGGVVAMVEISDAEFRKDLPSDTELGATDPDYLAEKMADACEAKGGMWFALTPILREACDKYRATQKAYQDAVTVEKTLRDTAAEINELKLLNLQAQIYIQRNALPGTPSYDALTAPKKSSKKKSSASEAKSTSTDTEAKPAATTAAESKVEAPAVNVVVPSPKPTETNGVAHA